MNGGKGFTKRTKEKKKKKDGIKEMKAFFNLHVDENGCRQKEDESL